MVETSSHRAIKMYPQLSDAILFALNEINEIKYYFTAEVHEKETMSKTLSRYITAFDYNGRTLLVLSVISRKMKHKNVIKRKY